MYIYIYIYIHTYTYISVYIFTDMSKLNINQLKELRKGMPEGSKAMCIKNRLMRRAAAGTPWAGTKETTTKTLN